MENNNTSFSCINDMEMIGHIISIILLFSQYNHLGEYFLVFGNLVLDIGKTIKDMWFGTVGETACNIQTCFWERTLNAESYTME